MISGRFLSKVPSRIVGTNGVSATLANGVWTITFASGAILPATDDGAALGSTAFKWSDLFLASGGVINWNSSDVTITHSANALAFAGATSGYSFDDDLLLPLSGAISFDSGDITITHSPNTLAVAGGTVSFTGSISPNADDGAALGSTTTNWSDLFLASGGTINWANSDVTITHASNTIAFAGGTVSFSSTVFPVTNDGAALGSTTTGWSDIFFATGAVVNFNNGNYTLTHSAGLLTTSGALTVGGAAIVSGNASVTGTATVTSADANAFTVGRLGATTPAFRVDASVATIINGLKVTGAASGSPVDLDGVSTDATVSIRINAKAGGTLTLQNNASGALQLAATATPTVLSSTSITKPNAPAFAAYNSVADTNVTGNNTAYTIICDTEIVDRGADYNNATGVFTSDVTGLYGFSGIVTYSQVVADTSTFLVELVTSNRTWLVAFGEANLTLGTVPWSVDVADLDSGDTASVRITINGTGADTSDIAGAANPQTAFVGYLVG